MNVSPDRNQMTRKHPLGYRPKLSFVVPLYKTPGEISVKTDRIISGNRLIQTGNFVSLDLKGSAQSPLMELKELTAKDNRIKYVS